MHSKSIWIVTLHHCNWSKSHIFKLQCKANRTSNKEIHFPHPASYRTHSEPLSLFAVWALLVCETCGTDIFQLYWLAEVDPMTHLRLLYRTPAVVGGGSDTRGGRVSWGAQGGSGCRIIHLLNRVHPDALMQYQIFFFLIFLNIFWVWGCAKCVMFKIFINTTLNIFMWESGWLRGNEHSVYCSRFFVFFFPSFSFGNRLRNCAREHE